MDKKIAGTVLPATNDRSMIGNASSLGCVVRETTRSLTTWASVSCSATRGTVREPCLKAHVVFPVGAAAAAGAGACTRPPLCCRCDNSC